jgi:phosphate transport system substrate-binding protein
MIGRFLYVVAGLAALAQGATAAEPVAIHGSTTVIAAILQPRQVEIERLSGATVTLVGNGSQRGLPDLITGRADLAMISAPLDAELSHLSEADRRTAAPLGLQTHKLGELKVAFAIHPSNPVRRLDRAQLAAIFAGTLRNWQRVGGPDRAIAIVAPLPGDGLRTLVENALLKGASLPADTRALMNAPQVPKVVSQFPEAIGIVAETGLTPGVLRLDTDLVIAQPLFLVSRRDTGAAAHRVIDAASAVAAQHASTGAPPRTTH